MTKGLIRPNAIPWWCLDCECLKVLSVFHAREEPLALPHYKPPKPLNAHLIALLGCFSSEAKQAVYTLTLAPTA